MPPSVNTLNLPHFPWMEESFTAREQQEVLKRLVLIITFAEQNQRLLAQSHLKITNLKTSAKHRCIYPFLHRIIPVSRRTEGGCFPTDDPRPRVAVSRPIICFRLWLHMVQRPPVPLLLFILSHWWGKSLLDHWKSLRISWCVAQRRSCPHTMDECTFSTEETYKETKKHMKTSTQTHKLQNTHTIWNWSHALLTRTQP